MGRRCSKKNPKKTLYFFWFANGVRLHGGEVQGKMLIAGNNKLKARNKELENENKELCKVILELSQNK